MPDKATATDQMLVAKKPVLGERAEPVTSFNVDPTATEPPATVRYLGPVPGIEVNVNSLRWGGVDPAGHANDMVERKFWSVDEARSFEGITLGELGLADSRKDSDLPAFEVTVNGNVASASKPTKRRTKTSTPPSPSEPVTTTPGSEDASTP